mmetsp:Transcript_12932/g.14846  ORF Transcript_12932/g.14846 Transcript_12932/m.14846 type:complete len:385 (+) Transcript_12932:2-1156(+)
MSDNEEEEEAKIDYERNYVETFGRKIPFPRLEIEDIQVNPIQTQYFYITKTQAIDETFVIKNFISDEDRPTIQQRVNIELDRMHEASDEDDSDEERDLGTDYFEDAIEYMRRNKMYNIDEDGMTKPSQAVSIVTRGTRTSGDSGIPGGPSADAAPLDTIGEEASNIESSEQSSPGEGSGQESFEGGSSDESGEDEPDEAEGDEDEADEEAGESEEESADANEESKQSEESREVGVGKSKVVKEEAKAVSLIPDGGLLEGMVEEAKKAADKVVSVSDEQAKKRLEDLRKIKEAEIATKNLANSAVEKAKGKEDEEKEEEEKFTEEIVSFRHFDVENSGKTIRSKPNVLICCKLEAFGYTVVQKIYSESNVSEENFSFSKTKEFSP